MPASLPHQSRRDGSTRKAVYAPWNDGSGSPASGLSQPVWSRDGVIFGERYGGSQLLPRVQHSSFHLRFDDTALPAFHWTTWVGEEIPRAHGKSGSRGRSLFFWYGGGWRHLYRSAVVNEEQGSRSRSWDGFGQEGQHLAFRDEGAHCRLLWIRDHLWHGRRTG